jgi:hypothetical protein
MLFGEGAKAWFSDKSGQLKCSTVNERSLDGYAE